MSVRLLAIGTATPPGTIDAQRSLALASSLLPAGAESRGLPRLYERSGVASRGSVLIDPATGAQSFYTSADQSPTVGARMELFTRAASVLATHASREALARAHVDPRAVTHIVTASCTGGDAPGFDQGIISELGLAPTVRRTHVGFMGCHAAINALAVGRAFALADPAAVVLVCCAELSSLHMHLSDRVDRQIADALFADGAAAAILTHTTHPAAHADAPTLAEPASIIIPGTRELMAWTIRDRGFEMTLDATVPARLRDAVPPWIDTLLAREGLARSDVGSWAIHPGGPAIVHALAKGLGLSDAAAHDSLAILRAHGNMSSATILFILRRLLDRAAPRPILAMAFGPGLAGEAILVR